MILNIQNQTTVQRSYLSGLVSVPASSSITIAANYIYPISRDSALVYDCQNGNVTLNDGINIYSGQDALDYLNEIASSLGGAVVALIGSTVPSYAITVGGKDPNDNAVIGTFDINANLKTLDYATSATGSTIPSSASFLGGQNPTGNLQGLITDSNGQLKTRDVIDVSSQYQNISVGTTSVQALGGSTILSNRKLICITPTNGTVYWATSSAVTSTTGSPLFPNNTLSLSFTNNVPVYLIANTTVNVVVLEAC